MDVCNKKLVDLFDFFIASFHTDIVKKNVFKANNFFEFIKMLTFWDGSIRDYLMDRQLLGILLDVMMGSKSPYVKA